MDLRLPLLADINLHLGVAEDMLAEDPPAYTSARTELEKAQAALDELRGIWPEMDESEQGLMVAMAKPLAARAKRLEASLPKPTAVSEGTPVDDPDQENEPED